MLIHHNLPVKEGLKRRKINMQRYPFSFYMYVIWLLTLNDLYIAPQMPL